MKKLCPHNTTKINSCGTKVIPPIIHISNLFRTQPLSYYIVIQNHRRTEQDKSNPLKRQHSIN